MSLDPADVWSFLAALCFWIGLYFAVIPARSRREADYDLSSALLALATAVLCALLANNIERRNDERPREEESSHGRAATY